MDGACLSSKQRALEEGLASAAFGFDLGLLCLCRLRHRHRSLGARLLSLDFADSEELGVPFHFADLFFGLPDRLFVFRIHNYGFRSLGREVHLLGLFHFVLLSGFRALSGQVLGAGLVSAAACDLGFESQVFF